MVSSQTIRLNGLCPTPKESNVYSIKYIYKHPTPLGSNLIHITVHSFGSYHRESCCLVFQPVKTLAGGERS